MLAEGRVHILATDAHNMTKRPPDLVEGYRFAERLIGEQEAHNLVVTRPYGILSDTAPGELPVPNGTAEPFQEFGVDHGDERFSRYPSRGGFAQRLQRLLTG